MYKRVENQLLKIRDELLKGIDENIKTQRSTPERDVGDFYDDVDIEKYRQMSHMLGEREREKLKSIDSALEKIQDGTFGECEECGEKIGKKRLQVIPYARYCIKCQSEMERMQHSSQNGEENLIYKDVSINDMEGSEE